MSKIKPWPGKYRVVDEELPAFRKETTFINFTRFRVLSYITLPIFIVLSLMDVLCVEQRPLIVAGYYGIHCVHVVMVVLLLLALCFFWLHRTDTIADVKRRHRVIVIVLTIIFMLSQIVTTYFGLGIPGSKMVPMPLVIMVFGFGAWILMNLAESLFFYIFCLALYISAVGFAETDAADLLSLNVNGTITITLAWVLSRIVYQGHKLGFIHRKTIERKNEEIRSLLDTICQSETEYRQLFENSPLGVFRTNADGRVFAVNTAMLKMLKLASIEDLNQMSLTDLYVDPKSRVRLWERLRTGPVSGFETVFRLRDGGSLPVSISGSLVKGEEGGLVFEGTIEDISERKRAEEELRRSEERYRLVAENIDDVIWTTDPELRFTYISPSIKKLRGLDPGEAMGLSVAEIMTPDSLDRALGEFYSHLPEVRHHLPRRDQTRNPRQWQRADRWGSQCLQNGHIRRSPAQSARLTRGTWRARPSRPPHHGSAAACAAAHADRAVRGATARSSRHAPAPRR